MRKAILLNNKAFFIPNLPLFELAFLNSAIGWFLLSSLARIKRGGFIEAEAQYVGQLPSLCEAAEGARERLAFLAGSAASFTQQRDTVVGDLCRRIPDLCPQGRDVKLSVKLKEWWKLDFTEFRTEVKRLFKQDVPLPERNAWEVYLQTEGGKVRRFTADITAAEHEIDQIVYNLFDLTSAEIALIEGEPE